MKRCSISVWHLFPWDWRRNKCRLSRRKGTQLSRSERRLSASYCFVGPWLAVLVALAWAAPWAVGGETLYNGIVLPDVWPPQIHTFDRNPKSAPYLANPPAVIPINVGRQLLVDDFLIANTTLTRTFHQPTWKDSPVLVPDKRWESAHAPNKPNDPPVAMPFSDGVWYDSQDCKFKMWYSAGYLRAATTCYAESLDGIHWVKPKLDVVPGTNIVIRYPKGRDSGTVWLDATATDPNQRYKMATWLFDKSKPRKLTINYSPDGFHWSDTIATSGEAADRSTMFYNPFRKKWVMSIKSMNYDPKMETISADLRLRDEQDKNKDRTVRMRRYAEGDTLVGAATSWSALTQATMWTSADKLDLPRPDIGVDPQLYNLDAVAYESLMIGMFSIWKGPANADQSRDKINTVNIGFSRDGFNWDRPSRESFLNISEDRDAWNYSNVQSVGGGFLVVGDSLYFYASGRQTRNTATHKGVISTGLAVLRRDGFASMNATNGEGTLTTRPLKFDGKHLFVNLDAPQGRLLVEVLDANGQVIGPFSKENCIPTVGDGTCLGVQWQGAPDLSSLAGKAVCFRFYLKDASLYAFWVSPDSAGTSNGYVAAGGPGFIGAIDAAHAPKKASLLSPLLLKGSGTLCLELAPFILLPRRDSP